MAAFQAEKGELKRKKYIEKLRDRYKGVCLSKKAFRCPEKVSVLVMREVCGPGQDVGMTIAELKAGVGCGCVVVAYLCICPSGGWFAVLLRAVRNSSGRTRDPTKSMQGSMPRRSTSK